MHACIQLDIGFLLACQHNCLASYVIKTSNNYLSCRSEEIDRAFILPCYCLHLIIFLFSKINIDQFFIHSVLFELPVRLFIVVVDIARCGDHPSLCFLMGASIKFWHAHFPLGSVLLLPHATWQSLPEHGRRQLLGLGMSHTRKYVRSDRIQLIIYPAEEKISRSGSFF